MQDIITKMYICYICVNFALCIFILYEVRIESEQIMFMFSRLQVDWLARSVRFPR